MEDVKSNQNDDVRTVVIAMRPQNRRDLVLPYVPKKLETFSVGVQRLVLTTAVENLDNDKQPPQDLIITSGRIHPIEVSIPVLKKHKKNHKTFMSNV